MLPHTESAPVSPTHMNQGQDVAWKRAVAGIVVPTPSMITSEMVSPVETVHHEATWSTPPETSFTPQDEMFMAWDHPHMRTSPPSSAMFAQTPSQA